MVKIVEGEDVDINIFALSKAQFNAVAELEAAIAKVKRLKMSLTAVGGQLFVSTREKYLDEYTEGAILQGALLASCAQGVIERVRHSEVGIVEVTTKGAVHVAEPLLVESNDLEEPDFTADRPLSCAAVIPAIRAEISQRKAKGRPSRPFIRGRQVIFK